jgi:hypothetical protein
MWSPVLIGWALDGTERNSEIDSRGSEGKSNVEVHAKGCFGQLTRGERSVCTSALSSLWMAGIGFPAPHWI